MKALQIERPRNGPLTNRLKSQKWNKMAVFLSCLVFGLITQALLQSAEAKIKYTVTRLGLPISGVPSHPTGLNAQGDVVGNYDWRDGTHHVFLNHAGVMHDIAALAGSTANGININGRIVGYKLGNLGPYTYFEGKVWPLSRAFPLNANGNAVAVNTASHIVCSWNKFGSFVKLNYIWQKSGLTFLPSPNEFNPTAINNSDQVVGDGKTSEGFNRAFLISGGQAIDLGVIQKTPPFPGLASRASAVNDQGQVVGNSQFFLDPATLVNSGPEDPGYMPIVIHAYIYSGGRMQDIQTIGPNDYYFQSAAYGVNNSGQVVGQLYRDKHSYPPKTLAFIYDGSKMIDLNTLIDPAAGRVLRTAVAINDAGQIVASDDYGAEQAYLLTPVR